MAQIIDMAIRPGTLARGTIAREIKQAKTAKRDAQVIGQMKTRKIIGYVLQREVYKHRVFLLTLVIVVSNLLWLMKVTNIKPF